MFTRFIARIRSAATSARGRWGRLDRRVQAAAGAIVLLAAAGAIAGTVLVVRSGDGGTTSRCSDRAAPTCRR